MKLLKQLIQVLDERGIQVNNLNIDEGVNGEYGIDINKEITIVDRVGSYALYTRDARLNKTYYNSLTEALEVVSYYLGRVKEGSILYSCSGICKYKVIKHASKDLYNLLDVHNNRLLYLECKSLDHIQDEVNEGIFNAK